MSMYTFTVPEVCDDKGARHLAEKIADYWRERGIEPPKFTMCVGSFTPAMRRARVDLRSDMRNGWPKGYTGDKAA